MSILEKDSTSLAGDIKLGRKVIRQVAKKLSEEPSLTDPLASALTGLRGELQALADVYGARLGALPDGKFKSRAQSKFDKYAARLGDLPDTSDPAALVNALQKAVKKSKPVEKNVAKAEKKSGITPCTDGASTFTATVDGVAFDPQRIETLVAQGATGEITAVIVDVYGPKVEGRPFGQRDNSFAIGFSKLITPGIYDVNARNIEVIYYLPPDGGGGPIDFAGASGSFTVTEFDLEARRFSGSVDLVAPPPVAGVFPDKRLVGTFDLRCVNVCNVATGGPCLPR